MTTSERFALAKLKTRGWKRALFIYMESVDLGKLDFKSLPTLVKRTYESGDDQRVAEIAAIIATCALMRTSKREEYLSSESLEEPTRFTVIALGVGSVCEMIGIDPRGGYEISEALREAGFLL